MKLFSCDNCGVVLDSENVQWLDAYDRDQDPVSAAKYDYDLEEYVIDTPCPVCGKPLDENERL